MCHILLQCLNSIANIGSVSTMQIVFANPGIVLFTDFSRRTLNLIHIAIEIDVIAFHGR